jgi:L-ascorbate metabolism protein UlaG (beta-lactamase superfamily)
MRDAHMNPREAVQAHLDLKSKRTMGIHFGLWQMTDEGIDEPVWALKKARQELGVSDLDFGAPEVGEEWLIPEK